MEALFDTRSKHVGNVQSRQIGIFLTFDRYLGSLIYSVHVSAHKVFPRLAPLGPTDLDYHPGHRLAPNLKSYPRLAYNAELVH